MATIKIPHGNDFTLYFPLVLLTNYGVEQNLVAEELTDITVQVGRGGNNEEYAFITNENYIIVDFDETLARGIYDVHLRAKLEGRDIASHLKECFAIVAWNKEANFQDYVFERSQIVSTSVFIGSNVSIEEIENLKAEYQNKIAEAVQAKQKAEEAKEQADAKTAEFANAALELDDVAKQSTLLQAKAEILEAIERNKVEIQAITDEQIKALFPKKKTDTESSDTTDENND